MVQKGNIFGSVAKMCLLCLFNSECVVQNRDNIQINEDDNHIIYKNIWWTR